MPESAANDPSNGYEANAKEFISGRSRSDVGAAQVRKWCQALPPGAAILDLGCGCGVPISEVLIEGGFAVHGVDASPAMVDAFRKRFPRAEVICESIEQSQFFSRKFEGAVSWGLMFLLPAQTQLVLIRKAAAALKPGGRFLFTSPEQICTWADLSTGRESRSLGAAAYAAELADAGLALIGQYCDDGDNHYFDAVKTRE